MFIDPHVHCRDEEQEHKTTIEETLALAWQLGYSAIFDMPNAFRPVTGEVRAKDRLRLAAQAGSPVVYGTYVGLTGDDDQTKQALKAYDKLHRKTPDHNNLLGVVGFKLFAGHSTGNLGVLQEEKQQGIYQALAKAEYKGVLVVHCEKEALLKYKEVIKDGKPVHVADWNPEKPITHAYARPAIAEVESVKDQIKFTQDAGYKGVLHIAHVSTPEAVDLAYEARKSGLNITCGSTPHHLLMNQDMMDHPNGLVLKMNPPLRSEEMRQGLMQRLRDGKITFIETDHAPHALKEKHNEPYMSGVANLHVMPEFDSYLKNTENISKEELTKLRFDNIAKTFGITVPRMDKIPNRKPMLPYAFDPFVMFKKEMYRLP